VSESGAAINVGDVAQADTPLSGAPAMTPFVGTILSAGGAVSGYPAGTPVALAGAPTKPDVWHADRAVAIARRDEKLAGRVVLAAHFIYLLRRAEAMGGETIHIPDCGAATGLLNDVAARFALLPAGSGAAELLVLTGGAPAGPFHPGCRALRLAGAEPVEVEVVSGPPPIADLRIHVPIGSPRWPMARCLAFARTLDLGGEPT